MSIQDCLEYCLKQNGLDYCKNCGLNIEMLNKALEEERERVRVTENTSDGYHTFKELYEHRITLYIALCKSLNNGNVWRSHLHSDGSNFDGWFILGIWREKGKQITYHLPNEKWEKTNFAETLDKAPDFDGHTSKDVLTRLSSLDK